MTRREAADYVGRDPRTVDRWANEGRLTRYKIGGLQHVRFSRAELDAMRAPAPASAGAVTDPFAD